MAPLALIFALLALPARAADEPSERLLDASAVKVYAERVGTFTYLHCDKKDSPDCALFEKMEVQPQIAWDDLIESAIGGGQKKEPKKKSRLKVLARAQIMDQYAGIWLVALLPGGIGRKGAFAEPFSYAVAAKFPGYRVSLDGRGAVKSVEVVGSKPQWAELKAAQTKR